MPGARDLVVGFACTWWTPRANTWSFTANRLREALDRHASVVDIETQRAIPLRIAEAGVARITRQPWQYTAVERALVDRKARRGARRQGLDAVIQVADVDTPLPLPTFPYQDMSIGLGLASKHGKYGKFVNLLPATPSRLEALARRGDQRLSQATGVCTMSRWMAEHLLEHGIAADRVRVIPAGLNRVPTPRDVEATVQGRLLFVGVDFFRKGGDAVVAAASLLRDRGVDVHLTVIGPRRWPMDGAPPSWVEFIGGSPAVAEEVWGCHDAFVMPSRFEAYGIAMAEAQAAGLPCVGYNGFAMPEIVDHGKTGWLVDEVEPEAVADAIETVLTDSSYLRATAAARDSILERHDWDRAAERMLDFVKQTIA